MAQACRLIPLMALVVLAACCGPAHAGSADHPAPPVPSSIADILARSIDEIDRGMPVTVRGVVTFEDSVGDAGYLCIQQESAGIWLRYAALSPAVQAEIDRVRIGDTIEATGSLDRGAYAPTIEFTDLAIVGAAAIPTPVPTDGGRLFSGALNGIRVRVDAVIQDVVDDGGHRKLIIESSARRLVAWISRKASAGPLKSLIDAEVRIVGVVGSVRNTRGEFLRPGLLIAEEADVTVTSPARSAPFDAPLVPLESIGQYRREPDGGHRIRTAGIVTFSVPGRFMYLQTGLHGVRVETADSEPLMPGDRVEVAGFMHMRRGLGELASAVVRRTGHGDPPAPVALQPDEIVSVNVRARETGRVARPCSYHGCLVRSTGKLVEITPPHGGHCRMLLAAGESILSAILPDTAYSRVKALLPGSRLAVTGVAELNLDADDDTVLVADPEADRIGLLVRSSDDVIVVQAAPWWTPGRLAAALAVVACVLGMACAWVVSLRRQVMAQAATLAAEMQSRHDAAVEHRAAMRERSRLSANLHDTVLQTVTGIGFQLRLCRKIEGRAESKGPRPDTGTALDVAQRMVDHAIQQLRGTVWALHMTPTDGRSFVESLDRLAAKMSEEHGVPITVHAEETEPSGEIADVVAGSLLLVAQEAIRNAVKHGSPSRITVAIRSSTDTLGMTVQDDGAGFDTQRRPGPALGHFGVEGMRDRVERVGGRLSIESAPGMGTTVVAFVPLDETAPRLSHRSVAAASAPCSDAGGSRPD